MHETNTQFRHTRLARLGGLLYLAISSQIFADELQLGRYQSVALVPTHEQRDLLGQLVELDLGPEITTLGQATERLLTGSGYRLLSAKLAEPYRVVLFGMPVPDVHRHLGPIRLRDALELMSGDAFHLVVEPTYRLVTFTLVTRDDAEEGADAED